MSYPSNTGAQLSMTGLTLPASLVFRSLMRKGALHRTIPGLAFDYPSFPGHGRLNRSIRTDKEDRFTDQESSRNKVWLGALTMEK